MTSVVGASPSELLSKAADLIRDTAAAAEPGPWGSTDHKDATFFGQNDPVLGPQTTIAGIYHGRREGTGRWIALLNPAVAPALEAWLRAEAEAEQGDSRRWRRESGEDAATPAIQFAKALLGTPEEDR